jgi:membrane protease YdiL (CAAX protease family)
VEFTVRLSLLVVGVALYYGWAIRALGQITRPAGRRLLSRLKFVGRFTADELESLVSLVVAAVGQALFLVLAFVITDGSLAALVPDGVEPILLLLGALLGVGEAALASFLGFLSLRAAQARAGEGQDSRDWLATGRGGWIRFYLRTAEIAPAPLLLAVTAFYVSVEETLFRGVMITFLSAQGAGLAVALSTILFVTVQVFHMPSWRAAIFPALGGLVIGVVHGVLFVATGDLAPLIVAHLVMFLVFVW